MSKKNYTESRIVFIIYLLLSCKNAVLQYYYVDL